MAARQDPAPLLIEADEVVTLDPQRPSARVVLVEGERITWVGEQARDAPRPDRGSLERLRLAKAWLQPGFVDTHAHLTMTGLGLSGLDLHGCRSVADCLAAVRAVADILPGRVIFGSGWDEFGWPEQRAPTADELAEAAAGRPVLLTRADHHTAVIDRVSLEAVPLARADGVERDRTGRPTGLLRREAQQRARRWFLAELPATQLERARQLVTDHAAGLGIVSVHEMGGPDQMGLEDFDRWATGQWPIEVVPYWADVDLDVVTQRGLRHLGGAFDLDGTLGSRTAALTEPYADHPGDGYLYRHVDDLRDLTIAAARRRVQVAFHCIGDRAVRQAVDALEAAARVVGNGLLRSLRPRLEHCELVPDDVPARMAALGVVASVRPVFDRRWGGPGGLYQTRLGAARARRMNPLRPLHDAGVVLAFGSDADVTPMAPWAAVDAAVGHHNPSFALPRAAALHAATRGGRHAALEERRAGRIQAGQLASLAAFVPGEAEPDCVLTVVRGRVVHDRREQCR